MKDFSSVYESVRSQIIIEAGLNMMFVVFGFLLWIKFLSS